MSTNHTPRVSMLHPVYIMFRCRRCGKPAYLDIASGKPVHAEPLPSTIRDETKPPAHVPTGGSAVL